MESKVNAEFAGAIVPIRFRVGGDRGLWKTSTAWAGTCRQFVMTLDDGSVHRVTIKFQKLGLKQVIQLIFKII